jgi:hypothetical protein
MCFKFSNSLGVVLSLFLAGFGTLRIQAQTVPDLAFPVGARAQSGPPLIRLSWPVSENATGYTVLRRIKDEDHWGQPILLPADATEFVDSGVVPGVAYEYHVLRSATGFENHAYIMSGIQLPLVEDRGKVILLVEDGYKTSLATELSRLQDDLVGDGWTVLRHDVPRMAVDPGDADPAVADSRRNEIAAVKNLIKTDYLADPSNVRAIFILGHLPVPYSGVLAPDQHVDHLGAWPADGYYADMNGTWTDESVTSTVALDPRNRNVPGDGKFDQNQFPAALVLQVGRVDMANLPGLQNNESDLLRTYLDKDHYYRHKLLVAAGQGLIDDNLGVLNGEVPFASPWANLAALVGEDQLVVGRWLTALSKDTYLWAYGSGLGSYSGIAGVADTSHLLVYDVKAIFTMLFGSYFVDWDSENDFMRAILGGSSSTLASLWSGRPYWYLHHMGVGETIGFGTQLSQNNSGTYLSNYEPKGLLIDGLSPDRFTNEVHVGLMGDPTLRLHTVAPPDELHALDSPAGGVALSWTASREDVLGYNIYRAPARTGPYTRLNAGPVSTTFFVDSTLSADRFYEVKAVKLETSGSGSYYNSSQGIFAEATLDVTPGDEDTWAGRDSRVWRFNDVTGTAGSTPGWDRRQINGFLNVTANPISQFTVQIVSSTSNGLPGPPANFDKEQKYFWEILTASGGILGFDPAAINLDTSQFLGDLGGGRFSLSLSTDARSIDLVFTPNHPPATTQALFTRPWDTPLRVDIKGLLDQFTSDPDGDARAFVQIGTSTNGTAIRSDGATLVFTSPNNLSETIQYLVQDVRTYRPGDTIRIVTGAIRIVPVPEALSFSAYHAIELQWQGEPGKIYQMQSRLDTDALWTNQGSPFLGTGETQSFFERTTNATKFYRIILLK